MAHVEADHAIGMLMEAPETTGDRALLLFAGDGGLASEYASRYKEVICHNSTSSEHAACLSRTVKAGLGNVHCVLGDLPMAMGEPEVREDPRLADLSFPPDHFDQIVFRLGRGSAQVNAALIESFRLLRPGGGLLVAGHNQEGIKSFAKRAEDHFGNIRLLRLKHSCRLLRFTKETEDPVRAIEDPRYFLPVHLEVQVPGIGSIPYLTKPGIFAYRATDPGTALLAGNLAGCSGKDVLDLFCGSGVLSLAAFALGAKSVLAVDSSAIAIACAARNFAAAGVPGRTLCADFSEGWDGRFDLILANPPFHRDSETDYSIPGRFLDAAVPRLRPGGELLLVANAFLDYAAQGRQRFARIGIPARDRSYAIHRMVLAP